MPSMPIAVLVLLVVLAVAGGLYVGYRASQQRQVERAPDRKGLGARARNAATQGVVDLWRWNRTRKKKARDRDRNQDRDRDRDRDRNHD